MATFLELCRDVARESGTVAGVQPATVLNATGRLGKVVEWTSYAWVHIQRSRRDWRWMRRTWQGATVAGVKVYTAASFNLLDLARFEVDRSGEYGGYLQTMTIYGQVEGQGFERPLVHVPWDEWRQRWDYGLHDAAAPREYAISPTEELCLGPRPDGIYVVRGTYRKQVQRLALDADVPEMPSDFHDAITWKALLLLGEHDEAAFTIGAARGRLAEVMADLVADQIPPVTMANVPLA